MTETDTAPASRERRSGPGRRIARPLAVATALALGLSALVASPAEAATVAIADVQGTGSATPFAGRVVTVEGVVTADYRGASGYAGIVIQTPGSGGATDQTPGASDGIFVYLASADPAVAIGDLVRVTGTASERQGQTQLAATATDLVRAGVGVPAATPLPDTLRGADRESLESMLVTPTGDYRVGSAHQLDTFGTLWLSAGADLPVKATDVVRPGAEADPLDDAAWSRLVRNTARAAEITRAAGFEPTFHHHAGTFVESPEEIDRFLDQVDVGLTLDTGHLVIAGGDPIAAISRWGARITHLHLKDVDAAELGRVLAAGGGMREVWSSGAFVAFGLGDVDLASVMTAIEAQGYDGWVVVEQDVLNAPDADIRGFRAERTEDQRVNREALRTWA